MVAVNWTGRLRGWIDMPVLVLLNRNHCRMKLKIREHLYVTEDLNMWNESSPFDRLEGGMR